MLLIIGVWECLLWGGDGEHDTYKLKHSPANIPAGKNHPIPNSVHHKLLYYIWICMIDIFFYQYPLGNISVMSSCGFYLQEVLQKRTHDTSRGEGDCPSAPASLQNTPMFIISYIKISYKRKIRHFQKSIKHATIFNLKFSQLLILPQFFFNPSWFLQF